MMRPTGLASGAENRPQIERTTSMRADRRDQVVADAAPRQFAVEHDVVDAADHDDARAGVADFGELVEPAEDVVAAAFGFEQDDVRRRRAAIGFDRGGDAAHLDLHMRLGQAAVLAGGLHGGGGFDRLAEGLHRDARRRRDMLVGGGAACGRCRRHRLVLRDCDLTGVLDHFPTSLILPVS